jgi:hypothetical protein
MSPNCHRAFSNIGALDCQQIFSNTRSPDIASNNLAIKEVQIASNQDEACPRHLAMLMMSC